MPSLITHYATFLVSLSLSVNINKWRPMLTHANERRLNVEKVTIVTAEHTIEKVFIISIIFFPFCFLILFFFSSCSDKHSSSRDFHHCLTPYLGSSTAPRQVQDIFTVFNQMDNILGSYTQYLEQASVIPVICSQYIFPFPSLFLPICLLPPQCIPFLFPPQHYLDSFPAAGCIQTAPNLLNLLLPKLALINDDPEAITIVYLYYQQFLLMWWSGRCRR